ncbi:MAG: DNRLRE domain-containing protein [Oscillospiraceae bacterium]|jgi:RHS repeat-associated protein|nr:DNRLRE domain-containing protein [Oscillospiraceae bacterium]
MKKRYKMLAVVLSVVFFAQTFTLGFQVVASDAGTEQQGTVIDDGNYLTFDAETADLPETDYLSNENTETPELIGEVESLRDENTKHFRNADGTYTAMLYPEPVHYEKEGKWKDIDNTLIAQQVNTAAEENAVIYRTKESGTPVIIPQTLADGQKITVASDGYTVGFGVSQNNQNIQLDSLAQITDVDALSSNNLTADLAGSTSQTDETDEDAYALNKITSAVTYKDIFADTDLEYVISSNRLKENIVIYEPQQEYIYKFDMDLDGLIPQEQEDGSIYLLENADDGKPVFILQAPYMYDANDEVSYAVEMNLTENDGVYTLSITVDPDWLNDEERVFPVVIDPTLEFKLEASSIYDAYVRTLTPNKNFGTSDRLMMGRDIISRTRSYLKFDLPDLPDCSIVTNAVMKLYKSSGSLRDFYVNVYNCNGMATWTQSGITWNNQPYSTSINGYQGQRVEDYTTIMVGTNEYSFNITKATKEWYEKNNNNGLMLASSDESTINDVYFYSSEESTSSLRPVLTVSYVNNTGLEDYWTYENVGLGRSGTLFVNHYNGGLTYLHGDVAMNGGRMPIAVNHVYTSNKDNSSGSYLNMNLGNGFKLNVLEQIVALPDGALKSQGYIYKFIDADNTVHFFKSTAVSNQFAYEYGTDLIITKKVDNTFEMTDETGNVKRYNSDGYLIEVEDANDNKQTIVYNGGKITKVVDPVGREVTFSYDASNYLTGITDPSGRTVSYIYTVNGYLDKIIYPDAEETQILYNTNNNIARIISSDSSDVLLTYKPVVSKNKISYRVSELDRRGQVNETSGNRESVNQLTFSYNDGQTVVSDQYGKSNTHLFDHSGRTVNVRNHEGQAQYTKFNTSGNLNNTVQKGSSTQAIVNNLVKNHSFEYAGDWNYSFSSGTTGSFEIISGDAFTGNRYLSITQESAYGSRRAEQTIAVEAGQTYTLSSYIKIPSAFMNPEGGVRIRVVPMTTNGGVYEEIDFIRVCDEWTRYQYTVKIPQNSTGTLGIFLDVTTQGTAYFDAVQLEKSDVVNQYNLLENNDFTYVTSGNNPDKWTGGNLSSDDKVQDYSGKNYMLMGGDPAKAKFIRQTIPVNAKAGDTLVYSAFAGSYATGKEGVNTERSYAVIIKATFTDGTSYTFGADFNYDVHAFQTLGGSYILPKDCTEVQYNLTYYRQSNSAAFGSAALYVGSYGASYSYNSDGKLNTVKSDTGESVHYAYTGSDLTAVTAKKDNETISSATYTYDDKHNVTSATSSDGVKTEYFYEPQSGTTTTYGIPTRVKTSTDDGANKVETSTAYTADYNYPVSTTNERGGVTQYNYDTTKGLLLSATDPNGNTRTYTYDPQNDRQLSVTGEAEPDEPVTTEFSYQDNALSTIERNGTTYSYEYDHFMRVTATKVGSQTLASNTYNANSTLQSSTFGNGQTYEPEYDSLDRITKEKYNGAETYAYKYNANNQAGEIIDNESGKRYTLEYDLSGRLTDVVGNDGTRVKMHYDAAGNMENLSLSKNGTLLSGTMYSFQEDSQLIDQILLVSMGGGTLDYDYTSLNRPSGKTHTIDPSQPNTKVRTSYEYLTSGTNQTALVGSMTNEKLNGDTVESNYGTYTYTYDANGNITTISENGALKATYTYDGLNQLIREDNAWLDKSTTYTYDSGGNILAKSEYAYTTGTLGAVQEVYAYDYENANWKDLLTAYDGNAITYDEIGNPLTYDGRTFTWQKGRQLAGISGSGLDLTFKYNQTGLRTKKISGETTTEYTYAGGLLMSQTDGVNTLNYVYSAGGTMLGVQYNGVNYYYLRNLQGDVTGIYDSSGNVVANYLYDTWGKVVSVTDANGNAITDSSHIGNRNPIRYRGYYYDIETGYYYLQSRYYNLEWGRFLNTDALFIAGSSLTGSNMFAYCLNNPVMLLDPSGNISNRTIHDQVVAEVARRHSLLSEKTVYYTTTKLRLAGKYGYCDLYDSSTQEIWEVKRATVSFSSAKKQLQKYLDADSIEVAFGKYDNSPFNTGGRIDSFSFQYEDYTVEVLYEGDGIIYYQYAKTEQLESFWKRIAVFFAAMLGMLGLFVVSNKADNDSSNNSNTGGSGLPWAA